VGRIIEHVNKRIKMQEQITPKYVYSWAEELGAHKDSIITLTGGINNLVFRCGNEKDNWVIKTYAEIRKEGQERMRREVSFLSEANSLAPSYSPKLLYADYENCCVVMEFVDGSTFKRGVKPSAQLINNAVDFVKLLNTKETSGGFECVPRAKEGFLKLTEHLENIESRINNMTTSHLEQDMRKKANNLIDRLNIEYDRVRYRVAKTIGTGETMDKIEEAETWLSPGDFGFHNAVFDTKGVRFIDFEFAGMDDPAKTIIDFCLQPRNPVGTDVLHLLEAVERKKVDRVAKRCNELLPILRLKWLCIILSILIPKRADEIITSSIPTKKVIVEQRLKLAENYYSQLIAAAQEAPRLWL
jgi:hypothetical protein